MIQYYGKDIWKGNIAVEDALLPYQQKNINRRKTTYLS